MKVVERAGWGAWLCNARRSGTSGRDRRAVSDLHEVRLEGAEHQAAVKTCACGWCNRAAIPSLVTAPRAGMRDCCATPETALAKENAPETKLGQHGTKFPKI